MSLLREIQDAAINSNTDLASLLRKCKVLAARLGSEEFKTWVDSELSGYKDIHDLPEYRIVRVHSKGHFSGPFGSGLQNCNIPMGCLPEKYRETMGRSTLMHGAASLEVLVRDSKGESANEPWDPDFVAMVGQQIIQGMHCLQAWKVVPMPALIEALDEIRNRILNFVLEIEAEDPAAGEAALDSSPVSQEKVNQIFNTYITGDVQNVATGSHSFKQNATTNDSNAELFTQLLEALRSVEQPEVTAAIIDNVKEMRASQGTDSFKSHYEHFMSLLADHIQVLGPIVAPFLASLAAVV